jgi:perosamine synthetase
MTDIPIASPVLGEDEQRRVADVIDSGMLVGGEVTESFEAEFADYCGVTHGVATSNGTTALHAVLEAVGVEPGDSVVTTPFSFVATANAIRFAGGVPAFADVDPETFNLDPASVERRLEVLGEEVTAIVAVHLYGLPAEMDRLRELADEYDVALVADAAQAHGATYRGERTGSLADASIFSFYPTKNMTTGEGGMVTTDSEEVATGVRRFINHGRPLDGVSYAHVELGHNFRMTDMAAAIGRAQLEKLPGFVERRRENARLLSELLADAPVATPVEPEHTTHSYHQYTVRVENRDDLHERLAEKGIGSAVYYPEPIPHLAAYDHDTSSVPVAERLSEEVLSLPVHPEVSRADIERIADAVASVEVADV